MTGRKETGRKEMRRKTMKTKENGGKETGEKEKREKETGGKNSRGKATGAKAPGSQYSQELGGKGDMLRGVREMDNTLSDDTIAGQNAAEGIRRKRYSQEGVRRRTRMFMGDSIVRKTDSVLNKGDDVVVCFTGIKTSKQAKQRNITSRTRQHRTGFSLTRFNKIAIPNNKFKMASGQGTHWLIKSPTIFSSIYLYSR